MNPFIWIIGFYRRRRAGAEGWALCPRCGRKMHLEDRSSITGDDMRTYRCDRCNKSRIVNFGTATWKKLSDAREANEIPVPLWEFPLADEQGRGVEQTVVALGTTEIAAAELATLFLADNRMSAILSRPGTLVPAEAAPRWREVSGDTFPIVVSDAGRLARYARGTGRS